MSNDNLNDSIPPKHKSLPPYRKSQRIQENDETHPSNFILCFLSFLIPIVGLILGTVLLTRHEVADRKTGSNCLFWAAIGFLMG